MSPTGAPSPPTLTRAANSSFRSIRRGRWDSLQQIGFVSRPDFFSSFAYYGCCTENVFRIRRELAFQNSCFWGLYSRNGFLLISPTTHNSFWDFYPVPSLPCSVYHFFDLCSPTGPGHNLISQSCRSSVSLASVLYFC